MTSFKRPNRSPLERFVNEAYGRADTVNPRRRIMNVPTAQQCSDYLRNCYLGALDRYQSLRKQ